MRKTKLFSLLMLLVFSIGNVWAEDELAYTITFEKGSNDSGTDAPAIESGSTYASLSSYEKAYKRTNGMHISSSSKAGNGVLTMTSDGQVVASKIVTNALAKSSKSFKVTVTYLDESTENKTFTPGTTSVDNIFNLTNENSAKIKTIKFEASSGTGTGIASVSVYTASTDPDVSLTPSSLTLNPTSVATQEITVTCSNFGSAISSVTTGLYSDEACETEVDPADAWIKNISVNDAKTKVSFSVVNNDGAQRQVWLKVTASDGTSTVSSVLPITQKKAPLATIQDIYDEATVYGTTAKEIAITFDSWVVTGTSTYNAYVTDGTKGFVFNYYGHGFAVGDILTGTAYVDLKLSGKRATISAVNSGEINKATGGVITPTVVSISDLSGVNTGAPIIVKNVTYNGTNLVDASSNALTPHDELYADMAFTNGTTYNVTGIYKEMAAGQDIMPRSAADIKEVAAVAVSPTSWDFGTIETTASASKVFSVSGTNLEAGTLTLSVPTGYSVSPASIVVSAATLDATEVTVSKNTTEAGDYNGNLSISADCGLSAAVNVSITMTLVAPVAVTGLTLNKNELALEENATETLVATVVPNNATNKNVTWTTSDDKVATVDANGLVTAIKAGTATITCTSDAGNTIYDECAVTVSAHVVNPGTYSSGTLNYEFWGLSEAKTSAIANEVDYTVTFNDITVNVKNNTKTNAWFASDHMRAYADYTMTFSVPSGYVLKSIVYAAYATSAKWDGSITVDEGTYTNDTKSWSGKVQEVTFSFGAQNRIESVSVTFAADSGTAVENVNTSAKAVKVLKNGLLLIEKNGKTYNAQGQLVK